MNIEHYEINLNKIERIRDSYKQEYIRSLVRELISFHQCGATKEASLIFNTLVSNGYLISTRNKKIKKIIQ